MFHTNTNDQGCDDDSNSLVAGLLITTSSTSSSTTTTSSSSGKYGRLWRRSITVGVIVSLKIKKPTCSPVEDAFPSTSLQQQALNTSNPLLNFVSKAYNSFSSKYEETETPCYVPVPQSPLVNVNDPGVSSSSQHVIDDIPCREHVVLIVKERNLNSLKEFGGVEKAALVFGSDLNNGIESRHDSQVWHTNNSIPAPLEFFYLLLKSSNSHTVFILLVSAGLSFATEIMKQGPQYGWHDGVAILAAVFMLVTFPSVANFRRSRKLKKKKENKLQVKAVRSGLEQLITISNLVEGDIVNLNEGDLVPADGLVVNSDGLVLDNVVNSKVDRDQNPFLFSGSKVLQGHGTMLVTSVGVHTELGQVMSLMIHEPDNKTLLEAQIEKPNVYIENLSLFVSVLIALVAFIRLLCRKNGEGENGLPELKGKVSVDVLMNMFERILLKPQGKISILVSALTVVVIAIQQGMPFVITISLSCWNDKAEMENQTKIQNLSACATMGIVTVICIDATGGLVCKHLMDVNEFWIGEIDVNNDADSEINQLVIEALERGIGASVLVPQVSLCPTNDLLISWAKTRWSMDVEFLNRNLSVLDYRKSSSNNKGCGVLVKTSVDEETMLHMHWSGAASTILEMCSHYYDSEGNSHEIKDDKSKFQKLIKDMEDNGLRPVAFACRKTEAHEIKEDGLHLLALAGLKYSCQEALTNAGVRIILISEDELSAVREIACEFGIFTPESDDLAIEGEEIRDLNITERMQKLDHTTVMGSCLAEDKLVLVQCMQKIGNVVAFFGGSSTSDTAALKEADVGIIDATRCTEMARENSDLVISGKGCLSEILKFGRCAHHNIQKFTQLELTVCISGLWITLVTTLCLGESAITTIQLIWVNGIMCLVGGFMMVMELESQKLMSNKPDKRTRSLLTRIVWRDIVIQVVCQAFVLLIFQFKGKVIWSMKEEDIRKTMIFTSFTLCQIFNQLNAINLVNKEVLIVVFRKHWFLVALGCVIVMQVLVVEFAKSLTTDCMRLNVIQWGFCFILAGVSWGIDSTVKFILDFPFRSTDGMRPGLSWSRRWPYFSCFVFLFFSLSYYYNPSIAKTFR